MFAVKLCLPCPFCISNLTVTVKAHNMSFLMETLCQTSLMGNYISLSFVSPAIQGAWNIKSTWIYQIGRVCFTLLGDGTAYVIYLGAVSGKSSIPLGQKINNTIDGSGKYAILPDLGYNNHAISVNLINIFFPGPIVRLSKYFNYSSREISKFTGNVKQNSITLVFFRMQNYFMIFVIILRCYYQLCCKSLA